MELIKIHNKLLNDFTNLCAKALKTDYNGLRGFDTDNKVLTVYMAREILKIDLDFLCEFYRIDKNQLKDEFQCIEIAILIDQTIKPRLEILRNKWIKYLTNE